MNSSVEELVGELPVSTSLILGSERIRLLVTNTRLVIDHMGKRGAGAVAGSSILGNLSAAFEDLFRSGGESARRRGIKNKTPGEILQAHRDNFAIGYSEVINVTVSRTSTLNRITILTGDGKYEFSTRTRFDNVIELFEKTLRDKLTVQRGQQPKPRS